MAFLNNMFCSLYLSRISFGTNHMCMVVFYQMTKMWGETKLLC